MERKELKRDKKIEKANEKCYNNISDKSGLPRKEYTKIMTSPDRISYCLVDNHGTWTVRARIYDKSSKKVINKTKSTGLKVDKHTYNTAKNMMRKIVNEWEQEMASNTIHGNPLFKESLKLWLNHKKTTLRPSTIASYEYNINHILLFFGDMHTKDINLYQVRDFCDEMTKKYNSKTVKKMLLIIRGVMDDAVFAGIRNDNPADRIRVNLASGQKFEGKAYTKEQVKDLLEAVKQEGEPIRSAVYLGIFYGLRRSEICGLRWKDIDFENNTLHVCNTVVEMGKNKWENEATKTVKSNRYLDLGVILVPYLKELKSQQEALGVPLDKVCCWPDGRPVNPSYLSSCHQRVLKKYGLERLRLHDLRHTACSLLSKKVSMNQVRDFMGHEDISTTFGIYAHTDEEDKKIVSSAMDDILRDDD